MDSVEESEEWSVSRKLRIIGLPDADHGRRVERGRVVLEYQANGGGQQSRGSDEDSKALFASQLPWEEQYSLDGMYHDVVLGC